MGRLRFTTSAAGKTLTDYRQDPEQWSTNWQTTRHRVKCVPRTTTNIQSPFSFAFLSISMALSLVAFVRVAYEKKCVNLKPFKPNTMMQLWNTCDCLVHIFFGETAFLCNSVQSPDAHTFFGVHIIRTSPIVCVRTKLRTR